MERERTSDKLSEQHKSTGAAEDPVNVLAQIPSIRSDGDTDVSSVTGYNGDIVPEVKFYLQTKLVFL